jgi:hypothetical protein
MLVAVLIVFAIGYVIQARRGNGHGDDDTTADAPWEDEDGNSR